MTDVTIEVFYSPTCPHCPAQKERAEAFASDMVEVEMTDVTKQQARAQRFGVSTVPTTIVQGPGTEELIGFTGTVDKTRMQDAIDVAKGNLEPSVLANGSLLNRIKGVFD